MSEFAVTVDDVRFGTIKYFSGRVICDNHYPSGGYFLNLGQEVVMIFIKDPQGYSLEYDAMSQRLQVHNYRAMQDGHPSEIANGSDELDGIVFHYFGLKYGA